MGSPHRKPKNPTKDYIQTLQLPTQFSYLGDRNYIDITSINLGIYSALGIDVSDQRLGFWRVRIFEAIQRNGYIVEGLHKGARCVFEFKHHVTERSAPESYIYSYFEESKCDFISDRRPEAVFDFNDHFVLEKDYAHFIRPITEERTYNFMVLGRELTKANTNKIPRVVKAQLWSNLRKEEYSRAGMKFIRINKNFGLLRVDLGSIQIGEIIVRLYDVSEAISTSSTGSRIS